MIIPLKADNTQVTEQTGEQVITRLSSVTAVEQPKRELSPKEYTDMQCNNVVAFIIKWIKTSFMKDLIEVLDKRYKNK